MVQKAEGERSNMQKIAGGALTTLESGKNLNLVCVRNLQKGVLFAMLTYGSKT